MEQLVARRAHNPKVVGSSPAPATQVRMKAFNRKIRGFLVYVHPVFPIKRYTIRHTVKNGVATLFRRSHLSRLLAAYYYVYSLIIPYLNAPKPAFKYDE